MNLCQTARLAVSLATAFAALLPGAEPQPRKRTFHFEYKTTLNKIPREAKHIDVWIPVPREDEFQQIGNVKIDSPYPYQIATAPDSSSTP